MPRKKARAGAGSPEQGESAQATQQRTQADPASDGEQAGAPSAASPTVEQSETEWNDCERSWLKHRSARTATTVTGSGRPLTFKTGSGEPIRNAAMQCG